MTMTDTIPPKARSTVRFWDRIANRYARTPIADEAAYQEKLRITREYLRPDMDVLEFGCGTGSTALVHAPFVKRILAIDISSRMIEIARQKAGDANVGNVEFRQAAIDDFTPADRRFGAVLGLSILHLVEDRDATIAKVHDLLEPGGVFVSSTACLGDTMAFFKLIAPIGRAVGLLPILKVFTADQLVASMTRNGFRIAHRWQPSKGKAVFIVAVKDD